MPYGRFLVPALVVVCASLVAAGCGGSSKKTTRKTTHGMTVHQYAAKLNAICRPESTQLLKFRPTSLRAVMTEGSRLRVVIQTTANEIAKLHAPPKVKGAAADFVAKSRLEAKKLGDLLAAAHSGNVVKAQRIGAQLTAIDRAAGKDARTIGAKECEHGS